MESVSCPLCGGAGTAAFVIGEWRALHCDCGVLFLSPRPEVAESNWSHKGLTHASKRRVLAAHTALRIIARHRPSGRLLDFGAGGGHFLVEARKRGYVVSGVEVEPELIAYLRSLGLPCTPSIEGTHDIVYTRDVLSHLRDPVAVLGNLNDHLGAHGLLVMETGNYADVQPAYYPRLSFNLPDHLYFFGEGGVRKLLAETGFAVLDMHCYATLPAMWLSGKSFPGGRAGRLVQRKTMPYLLHAARYQLGAILPKSGKPQTMIVVAEKRGAERQELPPRRRVADAGARGPRPSRLFGRVPRTPHTRARARGRAPRS